VKELMALSWSEITPSLGDCDGVIFMSLEDASPDVNRPPCTMVHTPIFNIHPRRDEGSRINGEVRHESLRGRGLFVGRRGNFL
jgi:hypothetical protein